MIGIVVLTNAMDAEVCYILRQFEKLREQFG